MSGHWRTRVGIRLTSCGGEEPKIASRSCLVLVSRDALGLERYRGCIELLNWQDARVRAMDALLKTPVISKGLSESWVVIPAIERPMGGSRSGGVLGVKGAPSGQLS